MRLQDGTEKINEVNSSTFYISHKYSLNYFRKYCAFTNLGFGAIQTHWVWPNHWKEKKWVFQNSISSVYFSSRCFYCTSQKRKNGKTTKALVPNGARQSKNCRYHLATKQANHNEKNGILERLPTEFRKQNSNWKKWVCLEKTLLRKSPIGIDLPQMIFERFNLTDGATRNVEYKIIAIFRRNWSLTVSSPHTWKLQA